MNEEQENQIFLMLEAIQNNQLELLKAIKGERLISVDKVVRHLNIEESNTEQKIDEAMKDDKVEAIKVEGCGELFEQEDDIGMTKCEGRTLCKDCSLKEQGEKK
jgi:hypothetical protein